MINHIGKKCLITTDRWFYAPDGRQYRGVYGTLKAVHEASKTVGFIPNRAHANWFIEVGSMIIMGCQVLYFLQTDEPPAETVKDWTSEGTEIKHFERPSNIYLTD